MYGKDFSEAFNSFNRTFGDLHSKLNPKKIEAERRARQQYGACTLGGKCSREGNMCIPCAMTFKAGDNA